MRKLTATLCLTLAVLLGSAGMSARSQTVTFATCGPLEGWSFYHYSGVMKKERAGWQKDSIKKGKFSFKFLGDQKFDILIEDATGKLFSLSQDGGTVIPIRFKKDNIALVHGSVRGVVEIYNVFRESGGTVKMSLMQNKGEGVLIQKSSLLIGNCDYLEIPK
jgi:hypothetical protein